MTEKNVKSGSFPELIVSGWKLEVLSSLVDKPDYSYTIRELSKKTSGSYGSVREFVHRLGGKDVVELEKKGSSFLVNYNRDNRYHQLIRQLLRTESERLIEIAKEYAEKLYEERKSEIHSVVLFGSVARGSATAESDIDILVVTNPSSEEGKIKDEARKLAGEIGHEYGVNIVPLVEEYEEFKDNLSERERFEINIKKDGEVLEGEDIG